MDISRARLKESDGQDLSEPESASPGEQGPTLVDISNMGDTGCAESTLLHMWGMMGCIRGPLAPLLMGPGTPKGTLPFRSQAGVATTETLLGHRLRANLNSGW